MKKSTQQQIKNWHKDKLENNQKRNTLLNSIVLFERAYQSMVHDLEELNGDRNLIEKNWDETIELFTKKLLGDVIFDGVTRSDFGYQTLNYFEMFKEKMEDNHGV